MEHDEPNDTKKMKETKIKNDQRNMKTSTTIYNYGYSDGGKASQSTRRQVQETKKKTICTYCNKNVKQEFFSYITSTIQILFF